MLVLTRKVGETIQVGDNIEVAICSAKNGSVRVGITAPPDVAISRPDMKTGSQSTKKHKAICVR